MANNLKINYNARSFFFGPQMDIPVEYNTYMYSLDLKNLSEDFIRGLYMTMSDIISGGSFGDNCSLETDLKIEFPMKEVIGRSILKDTHQQLINYLDGIIMKDNSKLNRHNIINKYNSVWKVKCAERSKRWNIDIKSKYTARLRSIGENHLIQFDSLDFLAGIITGTSWLNSVLATMSNIDLIHEDFKLVKVEYDYQIDVSESYRDVNEQLWKVLDTLNIIWPLFHIISLYLPNVCKGVEKNEVRTGKFGCLLSPIKPNFFNSSNHLKCVTACGYRHDICHMCGGNYEIINLDNLYKAKIVSIKPVV